MSDRDDDKHCDTCQCHEEPKWLGSHRRGPEVIPQAKALLAWSDQMGNSQPAWQFEECARIHPLFWYRDEDYENEQVAYLQWGYNYEAVHLGEPNFFYATCFDLDDGHQYECVTDLEIVGAVYLLMRFPERPPAVGGANGLWGPDEGTVTRRLWENQLDMCCRFVPRFARYVEQVARNHDETYPALQVVMDEIEKPEVPTPMGYNYIAYEILEGTEEEWTGEEQDLIGTHNLLWVVHAMCEFMLDHKLEVA